MKHRILVDLDDTVVDLHPELLHLCHELSGEQLPASAWTTYNVTTLYGIPEAQYEKAFEKAKLFEIVKPIANAMGSLLVLEDHGYDIIYLTARAWYKNAYDITEAWLKKWHFPEGKLHVIPLNKSKAAYIKDKTTKRIDIVVDDNPKQIQGFIDNKTAEKIFLIDRPWNRQNKELDSYRISHVSKILKLL